MALQNCSLKTMGEVLVQRYYVPEYQRGYAWADNELNDFVNDIFDISYMGNSKEHFLGPIVIHNNNNVKYVVDGQQRLITSVCFIKAIKQICDDMQPYVEDSELKEALGDMSQDIKTQYIGRTTNITNDPHLFLQDEDRQFFLDNVQKGNIVENSAYNPINTSQKKLINALFFFYSHIKNHMNNMKNNYEKFSYLRRILNDFLNYVKVIYIESTVESEACTIFETLNARGKNLTQADLLKNYVLRSGIENANDLWSQLVNNVGESNTLQFINYYLRAFYKKVQQKDIYRYITENIKGKNDIATMCSRMIHLSKYYSEMKHPEQVACFSKKVVPSLKLFRTAKITVFYPIIFSMVESGKFSDNDIFLVFKAIENWLFRSIVICQRNTNKYENPASDIAICIFNGKLNNVSDIVDRIKAENVTDEEFKSAFALYSGNKNQKQLMRYILIKINQYKDKNTELNPDNNQLHLEHIMPCDNSLWNVDDNMHNKYLWRIGNLTLLGASLNESVSNKLFADKKVKYMESKVELNKDICKYEYWNVGSIQERQNDLAEIACKIWCI